MSPAQLFAAVFVMLLWALMLARIVMLWIDPGSRSRPSKLLFGMTEPLVAPLRRRLPRTGSFDAALVLVFVALGFLWRLLL